jgi:uncharacterized protein YdaU (DUF1376 family)
VGTDSPQLDVSLYMVTHVGDDARETGHLSAMEYGAFARLRREAWARGGYLPGDSERRRRLAGVDAADWPAVSGVLDELWCATEDGRIYHAATLGAVERARAARSRAIAAGRAGGSAPHPSQRRADAEQMSSSGRATVEQGAERAPSREPSPDRAAGEPPDSGLRSPESGSPETGHLTLDICPTGGPVARAHVRSGRDRSGESEAFGRAYQAYPRHVGRARAAVEWQRQVKSFEGGEAALETAVLAALAWQVPFWRDSDAAYPVHVPHFATYLSGKRWRDEVEKTAKQLSREELDNWVPKGPRDLSHGRVPASSEEVLVGGPQEI